MKILLALIISFSAQAETIHEFAHMVSKIENTEIVCSDQGKCKITGKDTKESIRLMTEVVGPGLIKDGWNGKIEIR